MCNLCYPPPPLPQWVKLGIICSKMLETLHPYSPRAHFLVIINLCLHSSNYLQQRALFPHRGENRIRSETEAEFCAVHQLSSQSLTPEATRIVCSRARLTGDRVKTPHLQGCQAEVAGGRIPSPAGPGEWVQGCSAGNGGWVGGLLQDFNVQATWSRERRGEQH